MYSTWKSFHMGYSNVFQLNHDVCSVCVITMDKNALTYFPGLVVRVYLLYSKSKTVGKLKKKKKNFTLNCRTTYRNMSSKLYPLHSTI